MSNYSIIRTMPGETGFELFEKVVLLLYASSSTRFKLGHDPVKAHLKGCYVLLKNDEPLGRFAFYENPELKYKGKVAACIGSYECVNDELVSNKLIKYAKELSISKGYSWIIGPMEGSTWNSYRFSKDNDKDNFFMEPFHHIYYNEQFIAEGFNEIASYNSNLVESLAFDEEKLNKFEEYYISKGAAFRYLDLNNLDAELNKIGKLSLKGFTDNFLYSPILLADFVAKYEQLKKYFDSELVWTVDNKVGELQAFVFAIKDYMDPKGETLIVKSLVRDKDTIFKGIGNYLSGKITQIAKEKGYKKIIHAFMIVDNVSVNISKKYNSRNYKSYALYGLRL